MHAVAIWRQVQISTDKRAHIEAFIQFGKAVDAELNRDRTVPKVRKSISNYVEMVYFVRLNDLIKVGWSRNLRERFRAYGPSVEVLCHYPGTRKDETELHQILTPFRAKGREWYHDSPMIQKLVAEKVDEHGPPYIQAQWTEPKKPATKPRYWAA